MGTILTTGKVEKLVTYDLLVTEVIFNARADKASEAIRKVVTESESFLKMLCETGVKLEAVEAGESKTDSYTIEEKTRVSARRTIVFRTTYSVEFVDCITRLIADAGFDADLDFTSSISNIKAIKDELAIEATQKARQTAESLAAASGVTIKGLERMKTDDYRTRYAFDNEEAFWSMDIPNNLAKSVCVDSCYSKLSAPQTTVEVIVHTEWNVE